VTALENLARIDQLMRKPADAESIVRPRAIGIREDTKAPITRTSRASIAGPGFVCSTSTQILSRRAICLLAQSRYLKKNMAYHPKLCSALDNLASNYREETKFDQAEPTLRRS